MTSILTRFKSLGAAVMLAATLGTAGLAVAPAVAQDAPPSGFNLEIPGGGQVQVQPGEPMPDTGRSSGNMETFRQGHYDPGSDDFYYCLEDREIIRGLRDYGFRNARIVRYLRGQRVEAVASWGRSQYSMRINRCTGVVDRIRLIRRGGFGFQFEFGN